MEGEGTTEKGYLKMFDFINKADKINTKMSYEEDLKKCPVCDVYLKKSEGFICPKCKRGPICKKHRYPGKRECTSCVFEIKAKEVGNLKNQEKSIEIFIKLLQYIFLVFSVLFISLKIGLAETVELLQNRIFTDYLIYVGAGVLLSYLVFYFILFNQRSRIIELESQISEIKNIDIRR